MAGPTGKHINLDSYVTATPPTPPATVTGYLIAAPKQINARDAKLGPRKGSKGQCSPDSFCE